MSGKAIVLTARARLARLEPVIRAALDPRGLYRRARAEMLHAADRTAGCGGLQ